MPTELHFLRPLWLLALLPLGAVLIALWRQEAGRSVWRGVVDAHLLPHLLTGEGGSTRRLPLILLGLGWLLGTLALAGPVWERLPQPVFSTTAKRVILLDLSPSMNAADVPPSRLARARFEIQDLLAASREGQVALIAFGPEPFVVSPLTGDAQTIAAQVPRLATDLLPVPGTRRTDRALELAGQLLTQAGGAGGEIVLIADAIGPEAPAIAAARTLAQSGMRVSVLGVGTPQGAPEPRSDGGFVADRNGSVRIARLDRTGLEALAQAGQGIYLEPDPGDGDTSALLARSAGTHETLAQPGLTADRWQEEGPWLLLVLLPLAALAFRRGWLLPVLALAFVLPPTPGFAFGWDDLWQRVDQQAARTLAQGDAAAAAGRFEDPAWRAAARYRAGDYAGALADLEGQTGAESDYNRGNALTRLGRLDQAIAAYERALEQDAGLDDARQNLELARKLKERQKQSENQKDQKHQQDGKDREQGQDSEPKDNGQSTTSGDQGQSGHDRQAGKAGGADSQGNQGDSKPEGQSAEGKAQSQSEAAPGSEQAQSQTAGRTGQSPPPGAGDFGAGAREGEPAAALADADASPKPAEARGKGAGQPPAQSETGGVADLTPEARERQQSMEAQLRRVPDDPSGLLRQRFLLQHLRREGRLP